ncbi:hepatitis A virus cellular receptor 2 homolog isoform X2 [Polypterus senegalus]|uniref:hepatitis A virus cellular receptor 2 homolog isoform X2 n=1 Tax=Polypterus senegalus TaxID=55291 RepID=UPI001965EC02|nr:hepatitis A virus cellular receptor 2 homolog isoform X2 [Polypterus senegalus]
MPPSSARCFLTLCASVWCEVLSSSEVAVTATAGHNVTLPCRYSSFRSEVHFFCWGRSECPGRGQCGSNEIYKWDGRVHRMSDKYQLTGDIQRGDLSLTVVNVTMEDSGPYCCRIEILGLFNDVKNSMWLTVTEECSEGPTTTPRGHATSESPSASGTGLHSTDTTTVPSPVEHQTESNSAAGHFSDGDRQPIHVPVIMVTSLLLLLIVLISFLIYKRAGHQKLKTGSAQQACTLQERVGVEENIYNVKEP